MQYADCVNKFKIIFTIILIRIIQMHLKLKLSYTKAFYIGMQTTRKRFISEKETEKNDVWSNKLFSHCWFYYEKHYFYKYKIHFVFALEKNILDLCFYVTKFNEGAFNARKCVSRNYIFLQECRGMRLKYMGMRLELHENCLRNYKSNYPLKTNS